MIQICSMDALESIKAAIREVLPPISMDEVCTLADQLVDDGVESTNDLKYVQPEDLSTLLKPIQVRKLIQAWKEKEGK